MTTTSFTSVAFGNKQLVPSGSTISYAISGTFSATLELVYSTNAGGTWNVILSATAATTGAKVLDTRDGASALVCWRCVSYTSGTATETTTYSVPIGSDVVEDVAAASGLTPEQVTRKLSGNRTRGVVLFGDSITGLCGGRNHFNTALIPANPPTGQPGVTTCNSYFHIANAKLGNPWRLLANCAIGGSTVTRAVDGVSTHEYYPMIDRWQDCLLFGADTVIWGPSGINDLKSNGQSGPDRVADAMRTILDGFLANGLRVIKISLLPMATGGGAGLVSGSLDQIAVRAARLYQKEKQLFTSYSSHQVEYIDVFRSFVDESSRYLSGDSTMYYDGLHQNNKGAWAIANAIVARMSGRVSPNDERPCFKTESFFGTRLVASSVTISNGVGTCTYSTTINMYAGDKVMFVGGTGTWAGSVLSGPYTVLTNGINQFTFACPGVPNGTVTGTVRFSACMQFFENPFFLPAVTDVQDPQNVSCAASTTSGAGSVTGTVPAGTWVVAPANATVACSLVSRADGRGNNLRLAITTTAAVTGIRAAVNSTQYVAVMSGTYKSQIGLQVSSASAAYDMLVSGTVSDGTEIKTVYALNSEVSNDWDTQDWGGELLFDTENVADIAPVSGNRVTGQSWEVRIDTSAAMTMTVDIGLPCLIKVS